MVLGETGSCSGNTGRMPAAGVPTSISKSRNELFFTKVAWQTICLG